jgi:hypothetical protein
MNMSWQLWLQTSFPLNPTIRPFSTSILVTTPWNSPLTLGQRYDLVIDADQASDNYWLHCLPSTQCSANNNEDGILAIINYEGVPISDPTSTPYVPDNVLCIDETGLSPVVVWNISQLNYGVFEDINIVQTTIVKWTMNNSSFWTNFQYPTLGMIEEGNSSYPQEYNVVSLDGNSSTVTPHLTGQSDVSVDLYGSRNRSV